MFLKIGFQLVAVSKVILTLSR